MLDLSLVDSIHGVVEAHVHRTAGAGLRRVLGELLHLWGAEAGERRFLTKPPSVAADATGEQLLGYFGNTRTRNIGYPNYRVFFFSSNFRVSVFKTRNLKNPNYPTRIFRVTRLPSHSHLA